MIVQERPAQTPAEARRMWIAALRSGKYKQAQGALRLGDSFCCLGVACELAVEAGVIPPAVHTRATRSTVVWKYGETLNYLPEPVKDWLGLDSAFGTYTDHRALRSLANDNDEGASFKVIADIIEREWPT